MTDVTTVEWPKSWLVLLLLLPPPLLLELLLLAIDCSWQQRALLATAGCCLPLFWGVVVNRCGNC